MARNQVTTEVRIPKHHRTKSARTKPNRPRPKKRRGQGRP